MLCREWHNILLCLLIVKANYFFPILCHLMSKSKWYFYCELIHTKHSEKLWCRTCNGTFVYCACFTIFSVLCLTFISFHPFVFQLNKMLWWMRGAEPSAHSVRAVAAILRAMQAAAQVLAPAPTIANRSQVARPYFLLPSFLPLIFLSSSIFPQLSFYSFVRLTSLSFPPLLPNDILEIGLLC